MGFVASTTCTRAARGDGASRKRRITGAAGPGRLRTEGAKNSVSTSPLKQLGLVRASMSRWPCAALGVRHPRYFLPRRGRRTSLPDPSRRAVQPRKLRRATLAALDERTTNATYARAAIL